MSYVVEDLFAEGNRVAARITNTATHKGTLMGIPATEKKVTFSGIDIFRVADGKIVEEWSYGDSLGLMQQIGAIPTN